MPRCPGTAPHPPGQVVPRAPKGARGALTTRCPMNGNQLRLTWQHGPVLTVTDGTTHLDYRPTPAETAALIKRLATYLATWHRKDTDLTDVDPNTDPEWQTP